MKKFLITGAAGFIGAKIVEELISKNNFVIGIDNLNNYYNVKLKKDRLKNIKNLKNSKEYWKFFESDIKDENALQEIFNNFKPHIIIKIWM